MDEKLALHLTDGVELSLPIAGIGSRSYAFIIDWHIRLLLAFAWALAATWIVSGVLEAVASGSGAQFSSIIYFAFLPASAIYFLYHPVLEILMRGRTPGKRMAGIRIVSGQGQTPGIGPILIRNVFRLVDALPVFYVLGLGITLATARQVRLGGLAADTLLVYDERPAASTFDAHLHMHPRLGSAELELAQDLVERWESLAPASRRRLSEKFLDSIGETEPAQQSDGNDRALYDRLSWILKESREQSSA